MRVALFGGTGFVGSYLVDALVDAGHEPSLLVRSGSEDKVRRSSECRVVGGSIESATEVAATLDGCDAAIYCIGILRENRSKGVTFEALQYEGAARVADLAAEAGIRRFLLMSANGVRMPGTPYQETKFRAERHVREHEFDATIFRPSVIFGDPRGRMEFATQLYRDMVSPPLPAVVFRTGTLPSSDPVVMSPVHVEDVADAFVAALGNPETYGQTLELGGPEILTWSAMLDRIGAATARRKLKLPMPIPLMRLAAAALDWLPFCPVTRDQLTMLAEGNTASPDVLAQLIGRDPKSFSAESLHYLLRRS